MSKQLHFLILIFGCMFLISCSNELVVKDSQILETNPPIENGTKTPTTVLATQTDIPQPTISGDSSSPTLTSTNNSPQESTEHTSSVQHNLYRFSFGVGYWAESFPYELDIISEHTPNSNELKPGNADLLSFSHFADKISYWVQANSEGHLVLADVAYTNAKQVYTDKEHHYGSVLGGNIHLIWTPDDQHIIIDASGSGQKSLIYHIESDVIEPWSYSCDSIAISPESNSYAIWCEPIDENNDYAVIEWGGKIWYSALPPNEFLIEPSERVESPWAWSADGTHIAFFDENTPEANLSIVDQDTKQITVLSYSAYWLSESYIQTYTDNTYIFQPVKWSANGKYLLIYTRGGEQNPCPQEKMESLEGNIQMVERACWQVIAADTGELIWPTQDKPYETFFSSPENVNVIRLGDAVITPDGSFAVIEYLNDSQSYLLVVDLQQGIVQNIDVLGSNTMRWGK